MGSTKEPELNFHKITFSSCIDADITLVLSGNASDREIIDNIEKILKLSLKSLIKDGLSNVVVDNTVIIEKK